MGDISYFCSVDQAEILGHDKSSKMHDAGLVGRVVKMSERVLVRREREASAPSILVE